MSKTTHNYLVADTIRHEERLEKNISALSEPHAIRPNYVPNTLLWSFNPHAWTYKTCLLKGTELAF